MNPVRQAIYDILDGDSELTDLATGGIFWREAPAGTQPPLAIYQKQSGGRIWCFDGAPIRDEVYLVKGVGYADYAEAIDLRVQQLLTDASLSVEDRILLLQPMPEDDVIYGEERDGEHYEHVGTHYRVATEDS